MWLVLLKLTKMNASTENKSLELALFFIYIYILYIYIFPHLQLWLVIRKKKQKKKHIHTHMNTAWKSNRAIEKCKFWIDGLVSKENEPLVKKKKEDCSFSCRSALCSRSLAIYRVKRSRKKSPAIPYGPPESFLKHSEEAPSSRIYCYINSLLRRKHKIWINL